MYACIFLQKYHLMQKKYFFSHNSVPFSNFSFSTLFCTHAYTQKSIKKIEEKYLSLAL